MRRTKTDLARAAQAPPALSAVRPPSRRLFCELHRATIGTHPVLVCGRCLVRGAAARSRNPQVRAAATVVLGVVEAGAQKGWGEGGVGEGGGGEGDRGVFANASTNPPPPPLQISQADAPSSPEGMSRPQANGEGGPAAAAREGAHPPPPPVSPPSQSPALHLRFPPATSAAKAWRRRDSWMGQVSPRMLRCHSRGSTGSRPVIRCVCSRGVPPCLRTPGELGFLRGKTEGSSGRAGKVSMVPLTSSLYVSGVLDSTEKVLVDIGTGYYVEVRAPGCSPRHTRRAV